MVVSLTTENALLAQICMYISIILFYPNQYEKATWAMWGRTSASHAFLTGLLKQMRDEGEDLWP